MSFTYSGYTVLEIVLGTVLGRPGIGFFRLGFSVKLKIPSQRIHSSPETVHPARAVSDLSAEIHVRGNSADDHLVGLAWPEMPKTIQLDASVYETQLIFWAELDRARVEALDELRNGGDLWFRPIWRCVVHGNQGPMPGVESSSIEFQVNQSAWMTLLRDMKYREAMLFEVPIPTGAGGALGDAVRYLQEAAEDYRAGRPADAVGDCRKALEKMGETFDASAIETAKQMYSRAAREDQGPNRNEMNVEQRFIMIQEMIRNAAHLATHSKSDTGYVYTRRDAAALIGVTTVILSRLLHS